MSTKSQTIRDLIQRLDAATVLESPAAICEAVKTSLVETIARRGLELPIGFTETSPDTYARRLLHACEDYAVVVMVWAPGQGTSVHNHDGKWCVEGVYEGTIRVTSYDLVGNPGDEIVSFTKQQEIAAGRGEAGALIPPFDYHVMENTQDEELDHAQTDCRQGRVPPGRAVPPRRLHRDQHGPPESIGRAVLQQARHSGAMDQRRQAGHPLDAVVVPSVPGERGAPATERPGLQPGQPLAQTGPAAADQALVAHESPAAAGENRGPAGEACAVLLAPAGGRLSDPAAVRCLGAQLAISVNNGPPPRDPRSRMTSFKRTQRKYVQKAYRVRNWREYETGLRARGSLTVWLGLTDGKLANWNSPRPTRRKPGRQRKYSNHAIETTVTLGLVFGLASRQTAGFLRSLLTLLNLDNDVPDHSTISRRKARLGKVASYERRTVKPVHLLIDSSGLSVHVGQLRTPPKARDYRKLHLAVDEQTSDVVACELTSKRARDASRVASLVGQIERPIASAKADAAYDTGDVYKTLENHRAHRSPTVLIPPRKGAQLALDSAGTRQRNRNIRARSRVGKRKWYVASGYSRRSKVETTFHRYKAILGSAMRARGLASQRVEVRLGCKILNTMTALGIPDGEMIG